MQLTNLAGIEHWNKDQKETNSRALFCGGRQSNSVHYPTFHQKL